MPNTLFEDNGKNAVTCILVFEAHKPHNKTLKTWFGYWKNDGFIKLRPYGRIDHYKTYQNKIKKYWLDSYFNKKEIPGFSVLQNVTGEDEWLVEPYIKTRFETLTDRDFINTLKEYTTFLYYNELQNKVSKKSLKDKDLKLDFTTWRPILLNDLFTVRGSKTTDKKDLDSEYAEGQRQYPYVTTQATNNGIRGFYDIWTDEGNILTIDSATIGYCAYQPLNFSASDHVEKLLPKAFELNVFRAMFLVTVINMEQYRYSYGRKFNQPRIRETIIKLPFENGKIDWEFIESYIKSLPYSSSI